MGRGLNDHSLVVAVFLACAITGCVGAVISIADILGDHNSGRKSPISQREESREGASDGPRAGINSMPTAVRATGETHVDRQIQSLHRGLGGGSELSPEASTRPDEVERSVGLQGSTAPVTPNVSESPFGPPMRAWAGAVMAVEYPRWLSRPGLQPSPVTYPPSALARGVDGSVRLHCLFSTQGSARACEVLAENPPGEGFGEAARRIVENRWWAQPATLDGEPVEASASFNFEFDAGLTSEIRSR